MSPDDRGDKERARPNTSRATYVDVEGFVVAITSPAAANAYSGARTMPAPISLAAPTRDERDDSMGVAKIQRSLRKRTVGEAGAPSVRWLRGLLLAETVGDERGSLKHALLAGRLPGVLGAGVRGREAT